jgi:V/A-type H+-transporting ATPase subunit D
VPRLRRVPPGRSGRLWLQHRLAVAERGAALLDQKLRILRAEVRRATLAADTSGAAWTAAAEEAGRWLLRASLLGGERAVRLASDGVLAQVELTWASTMGVRHPAGATCVLPPQADLPLGGAALVQAREAHLRAVDAAVRHAADVAAVQLLRAEEAATRRRLRAVQERWVPLLESTLRAAELGLEEQEHEDGVRLRWARSASTHPFTDAR